MTENVKKLPQRDQVPAELKWDVASVFANDDAWEAHWAKARSIWRNIWSYVALCCKNWTNFSFTPK